MTVNKTLLAVSFPRVLGLVAILASLTILTLPSVGVTNAQTETETPAPGEGGDPGGPAAPVLSTTKGPGWITLSWEPVSGANTYDVWWRFADGGSWRQVEGSPISNTAYGFIGTSDGTTLDFLVRSIAADGKSSPWSALHQETAIGRLTPTPTPSPTPMVSSNLPAPAMTARQTEANTIELRWSEVSGADRYELLTWWATDPGWQGLGGILRGTSYTHRGLTTGRTYHYAIRALDANGVAGSWTQYPYPTVTVQETSTQTPTPTGPTHTPTPTPTGPTTTVTATTTAASSTATPTATRSAGGTLPAPALTARTTETNAVELSWTEVSGPTDTSF